MVEEPQGALFVDEPLAQGSLVGKKVRFIREFCT
jgi:hypothetical protein